MTNWQTLKVLGVQEYQWGGNDRVGGGYSIRLDKHVEFSDGYQKSIEVSILGDKINSYGISCGRYDKSYIEIDIDRTKCMKKSDNVPSDAWRKVPNEVISNRNAIISASSGNSEVVAMNRELMDRVDRGQQTHFTYQIEDRNTGLTHSWVYKRN